MTTLQKAAQDWEDLAKVDPLWAVLQDPRKFGKWNLAEFFATGEREISEVMVKADKLGYPRARDRVLDFGCGVGRVTRALSLYFQDCHGIDISKEMIANARKLNSDFPTCRFAVTQTSDLGMFPDNYFDMTYSNLVLQHLPDQNAITNYISEFIRTTNENGLTVFQLPHSISRSYRLGVRRWPFRLLRSLGFGTRLLVQHLRLNPTKMNYLPEHDVVTLAEKRGGQMLEIKRDLSSEQLISSRTYFLTKGHAQSRSATR